MGEAVSIVECKKYSTDLVSQAVRESVDLLGGIASFVSPGDRVLLKPNFLIGRSPEKCVNTHPSVVRAVAQLVLERGAEPVIGDSPQMGSAAKVAEKCGVAAVARELGIDIVDFTPVEIRHPGGKFYKQFTVGKAVLEADCIINLPKLKTHSLTFLTLAVKNIFGCIPGTRKAQWHVRTSHDDTDYFTRMLLDLYTLINPPLSIVDGIVAMEGKGPGFGSPRTLGLIIAGTDAVAVDAVIAAVLGVQPGQYPILAIARSHHYGTSRLDDIFIRGKEIAGVTVDDFRLPPPLTRPGIVRRMFMSLLRGPLTTAPSIDTARCKQCGNCHKACPRHCIAFREGGFVIDKKKCIQCLCCMEVCPNGSVDVHDGLLLGLIKRASRGRKQA